jgi:hypothetical protein
VELVIPSFLRAFYVSPPFGWYTSALFW